jgi:2'-5' RNA ligase
MPAATLTRRDGVELARVGEWSTLTGTWRAAPEDFAAAIAATACPAVDRPYLRLGHSDPRFPLVAVPPRGDGEPALGWIDNLRLADGGHTLVGDWVEIPAWLNGVAASAYPRRSVEGAYNRRCALNHVHPFVLDGLALLGVTRPGVGTLKPIGDLADVRALFDSAPVAASSGEVRIAASIPASEMVHAAAEVHSGAMVALIPTVEDSRRLAVAGGEAADQLHVTLFYLGKADDLDARTRQQIINVVSEAVDGLPRVDGNAFALSVFNPQGDEPCIVLGLGGPDFDVAHDLVDEALDRFEDLPEQHDPYVPHLTLRYTSDLSGLAALADRTGPVVFDRVRIAFGGQNIDIPLAEEPVDDDDDPELVAAAAGNEDNLRNYWVYGKGRAKWRRWSELYRRIKKFVGAERAKRIAAAWFKLRYGYWPGDRRNRGVKASSVVGSGAMPNPQPSVVDRIKAAWNASAPFSQHIHMVRAGVAIVLDEADRSFWRVPVTVDGDTVEFGDRQRVMPDFVDYDEELVAASTTFATREESRPTLADATVLDNPPPADVQPDPRPVQEPTPPAGPPPADEPDQTPPAEGGVSTSGAEPDEPHETEGDRPVSTLSTDVRSRLGLTDEDDDAAVIAALDALKSRADTPPEPTPEQVAASAAKDAENEELRKEVTVLASQMQQVTAELAAAKAKEAAIVKASVLDEAQKQGKFTPAEREQWSKDYDEAPSAITRTLNRIAPGTAVPVLAAGYTGTGDEPVDGLDAEYEKFFRTTEKAGA